MSKNLSAKYYQENKERMQKKSHEKYQSLSKEEKEKSNNMVVNDTKISQKMKKKISWLSIVKNMGKYRPEKTPYLDTFHIVKYHKMGKKPYYNYNKLFSFRKFCLFIRASIRNFFLLHLCWKSCFSTNKISSHPALLEIFYSTSNQQLSCVIRIFFYA